MKTIAMALLMAGGLVAAEPPLKFPTLTTTSGRLYRNVEVLERTARSVKISHSDGEFNLPLGELPAVEAAQVAKLPISSAPIAAVAPRSPEQKANSRARNSPMLWTPYRNEIAVLKNMAGREGEVIGKTAKLKALQQGLAPFITEQNLFEMHNILTAAREGKLTKGAPAIVAASAWGEADRVEKQEGAERWWWRGESWVIVKDGLIADFSSETKTKVP